MCMIDDSDDRCTVISEANYTARKDHRCTECGRAICIGEAYRRETIVFEHARSTWKTCLHCQRVRDWLSVECGGWAFGEIEEDIHEHAESGYGMRVKMMAVGMDRKWQRKDGRLWPLPRAPQAPTSLPSPAK